MFVVIQNNISNYTVIKFFRRVDDHQKKLINLNKQLRSGLSKKEFDE